MKKIRIAIVGYGNLGRGVRAAIQKNRDMELVQIITRNPDRVKKEVKRITVFSAGNFKAHADVAILCSGSKEDLFGEKRPVASNYLRKWIENEKAMGQGPFFAQFFNTVDSFDTHGRIPDYYRFMNKFAAINEHTAVISAGWDPGIFSLERVLAGAFLPDAKHYSFWGPGISQGHSDAVRQIKGIIDARQYTLPNQLVLQQVKSGKTPGLNTRQKHRRLVCAVVEKGADKKVITEEITSMPYYFSDYDTKVIFVSLDKLRREHAGFPHGGSVIASGRTSPQNKGFIEYRCAWESNPEATAGILVACARAAYRFNQQKMVGAFTMLDIPPAYYCQQARKELLKHLM